MKLRIGKGAVVGVAIGIVVLIAGWFFLLRGSIPDVPDAAKELAMRPSEVEVVITFAPPEGTGDAQRFTGQGVVDVPEQLGEITYDLGELPNSAGGFGQLFDFGVIYESTTTYVEIFPDPKPPWVSFEVKDSVGRDLERLREVILGSPLMWPELVMEADYLEEGDRAGLDGVMDLSNTTGLNASATQIFEQLSDGLGVDEIEVSAEVSEGNLTSFEYRYVFPIAKGSTSEATVTVNVELTPADDADIDVPPSDQIRSFSSFLD